MTEYTPNNQITFDTRREAHETAPKEIRYIQIKQALNFKGEATAKELAVFLHEIGVIPTSERNFTAPRLTELEKKGEVEVIGKKTCQYTKKTVAIYKLKGDLQ